MIMIGKTISHYKILEEIGRGGMGVVYKAEDTKLNRTVALKFLPSELTRDPGAKNRFIREAQAAAALEHNNICNIYEINETEDGQTYMAMACYEGETLKSKIEKGKLKIEEAINYSTQIAEGLAGAHEKGIIHRDIKPANIIITNDSVVKIVDFGIAKLSSQTMLTKEGTTLGTVSYMSPEQTRGDSVDHRSDIWQLGVILYEMLTGQLPFKGEYDQAVVYSILNEEPPSILDLRKEIPTELGQVVEKALVKKPEERYQSVEELLADVRAIREKFETADAKTALKEKILPSIAVLPFLNMSADPEQEYFCDGMAEELISALTKIENLHVPARISAFAFKGEKIDVREIGRKLNVATVLEGSVRKAGNRLRITAQLINVADGYHLWSERFDRELDDVFAIQDEISIAIVDKLKIRILKGEKEKLVKRYTDNLEAYSLYLKGRYYWNSLTPEGWEKSFECYQKAIEIDPTYALAYVGLSIWHQSLAFWGDVPPSQAIPKSREFAQKAIELDDSISDAHNSLAVVYALYDWNWSAAEKEFKRSIELDPTNALGYVNYAIILTNWKRFEEALVYARRAQKLDPLSSMINTWVSIILMYAGQYEEAVEGLQQVIAKDPGFWQPHLWLCFAFISGSMFEEAVSAGEKAVELSGRASIAKAVLACTYFLSGRSKKGEELLESLQERSQSTYVPATFFVWIYSARNDTDKAFRWLQKAAKENDPWICWYGVGPNALRADDPRFDALLKKIGLE
jgi:serine/threonine protein kinase/Tfp pilus assembly protein PilF